MKSIKLIVKEALNEAAGQPRSGAIETEVVDGVQITLDRTDPEKVEAQVWAQGESEETAKYAAEEAVGKSKLDVCWFDATEDGSEYAKGGWVFYYKF